MAPPLVIGNTALVRLLWHEGLTFYLNVVAACKPAGVVIDQTLANTVGSAIKGTFTSSGLVSHIHTSSALDKVGIRDVSSANNVEFIDSGASVPGTAVGDPLPLQTALVLTLRTAK